MSRKINNKRLLGNTILYRVWVIIENMLFLWLFSYILITFYSLKMDSLSGSFTMSIFWNIINMATYWVWHYFFFKWFHMGAGEERHKMEHEIEYDENLIHELQAEVLRLKKKCNEKI